MKLTKKEERMLKSLPEATPVLRGKDAEDFLKKMNGTKNKLKCWECGSILKKGDFWKQFVV